ncbi:MAG TPA: cupin domain-containing protein [Thermoplasmataceae archaeon]|nr:cupin domain-containing protein [Thermoplasmatales archaeon AK]HLH86339.1 cupin domain-containing protein [Thermoplasmataceae archaeon]
MVARIVIDPPKNVRPKDAIRCDVAWKLFDPDHIGDFSHDSIKNMTHFTQWLWRELSKRSGYFRPGKPSSLYLIAPEMTPPGERFLCRIVSFWEEEIYIYRGVNSEDELAEPTENHWIPPLTNILTTKTGDPAADALSSANGGEFERFISPLSGFSHAFFRTYNIPPGGTYSRHHSHTAREEHYLILSGKGTARIGSRRVDVATGDIVFKPLGPDLPTQLLADKGEELKVLDMEIWQDPSRGDKDVVIYPDHGEVDFFGAGWYTTVPLDSAISADDAMGHYDEGYRRQKDGTWVPADVPGFRKREK